LTIENGISTRLPLERCAGSLTATWWRVATAGHNGGPVEVVESVTEKGG
jgi:hypothetical protein